MNLSSYTASDSLLFIDVLSVVSTPSRRPATSSTQAALYPAFDLVCKTLEKFQSDAEIMVIIDDIASLEWIGFSLSDVLRFSRALCALCRKVYLAVLH